MEKLSATLAFSRRMARRLGAENVAAELSKLIHAVSQLDQSLNECTDSPSTYQFSDQAVLSETISDSYMAKKRRKKGAQSVVLSCAGEEPRNEHLGADKYVMQTLSNRGLPVSTLILKSAVPHAWGCRWPARGRANSHPWQVEA